MESKLKGEGNTLLSNIVTQIQNNIPHDDDPTTRDKIEKELKRRIIEGVNAGSLGRIYTEEDIPEILNKIKKDKEIIDQISKIKRKMSRGGKQRGGFGPSDTELCGMIGFIIFGTYLLLQYSLSDTAVSTVAVQLGTAMAATGGGKRRKTRRKKRKKRKTKKRNR